MQLGSRWSSPVVVQVRGPDVEVAMHLHYLTRRIDGYAVDNAGEIAG